MLEDSFEMMTRFSLAAKPPIRIERSKERSSMAPTLFAPTDGGQMQALN